MRSAPPPGPSVGDMSEHETEKSTGVPDEQLPPDLVPGEENPLAEGLPDGFYAPCGLEP